MKKLILLVCFLLVSSFGYSQIDNFDYTTGALLTDNGWTAISAGGTNAIAVTTPGLVFPDYAGSGIGNAAHMPGVAGEDDTKPLSSSVTSGSLYGSFMMSVISATTAGDYFFALRSSTNAHNSRVSLRSDGLGGFNIGLSNTGATVPVYASGSYTFNTTYLVVVKYEFIAGPANDLISLFIFDSSLPLLEPTPLIGPTTGFTETADLTTILLRQGGSTTAPNVVVDGIYAETGWNNNVLPVELASFTSTVSNRDVTLNWSTASELNNSGFEIERSSNNEWTKVGNVNGNGTSSTVNNYSYTDRSLATGSYSYRLKQVDFNGNFEYFNLNNEVNIGTPSTYALSQNYPNPFNPSTTINFDLPTDGNVSLKLYDMSGKEVATLVNEVRSAGYYSVNFNASQLTSGVYFYTISADNFTATKKMLLVK